MLWLGKTCGDLCESISTGETADESAILSSPFLRIGLRSNLHVMGMTIASPRGLRFFKNPYPLLFFVVHVLGAKKEIRLEPEDYRYAVSATREVYNFVLNSETRP